MGTFVHGICSPASGTEPYDRIMLESPMGSKFFTAHDDAGSLEVGWLVYRTGGTQANDMTKAAAKMGGRPDQAKIYVVELPGSDTHKATNYDKTTTSSANDPILIREIRLGDRLWLKGSTLTCVEDNLVVPAAGFVAPVTDPNGETIERCAHAFISLGAMTAGTWMVGEYVGIVAYDDT